MNKFRLHTTHYIMLSNSSALLLGKLPRFGTIARQVFWHCCHIHSHAWAWLAAYGLHKGVINGHRIANP